MINLRNTNAARGTTSRRFREIVVILSSDLRDCRPMMSRKLSASRPGYRVPVNDVERILRMLHVQSGDGTRRSADQV